MTSLEDKQYVGLLKNANKKKHSLVRKPNAWMKCFGITKNCEVKRINKQILETLKEKEKKAAKLRKLENKTVMGASLLCSQPILCPHTPKKKERKVFIITSDNELRLKIIEERDLFDKVCRNCYERWKKGDYSVEWPPGAFRPPMPPVKNSVPSH